MQKYTYVENSGEEKKSKIIEAANDSLAYLEAFTNYCTSEAVYQEMLYLNSDNLQYLDKPLSFSLYDINGNEIPPISDAVLSTIKETVFNDILAKYSTEGEDKAFADAMFGMSIDEVAKLPSFKDYNKYANQLDGIRIRVGDETYDIFLLFGDKDELYEVIFTTMTYSNASALNTYIKDRVENLRKVIEGAYGEPQSNFGYPSIFDMSEGRITWAYIWRIGKKAIKIGVEEKRSGGEYKMYACIYDTVRELDYRKAKEDKKNNTVKESSSLF